MTRPIVQFFMVAILSIVAVTIYLRGVMLRKVQPLIPYPALVNQTIQYSGNLQVLKNVEQLAFSDDWGSDTERLIPNGGHVVVQLRTGESSACLPLSVTEKHARQMVLLPTYLKSGSSVQTPNGFYFDILAPVNPVTCQLSPFRLIEWTSQKSAHVTINQGDQSVTVKVRTQGRLLKPFRPFFVGLSNSFIIKGHCREYCPRELEFRRKYEALLLRHHITPIQSWIKVPDIVNGYLNLDSGYTRLEFEDDFAFGAMTDFVNFPRMTLYSDPQAYLRALERTIVKRNLSGRAWVYVRDEPTDYDALKTELRRYRKLAPSVRTMVTMPYKPAFRELVDIFAPNIAQWVPGDGGSAVKDIWPYASCMGSCGPNRAIQGNPGFEGGPEVDRPDFLIDRPSKRIDDFFSLLAAKGVSGGLYYHAVEGHRLYRKQIDVLADPWNFGGNGDGVLAYPGRPGEFGLTEHMALPSFRMTLIRQAIERYWLKDPSTRARPNYVESH